jgi:uncharacterized protein YqeY
MDTKAKLETELKNAMRTGDETAKRTIRLALSSIRFEEKTKGIILDENSVLSILQKEIKMRQESIQDARKGNRTDLVEANEAEIKVIESFLPKQLSEEEIKALTAEAIQESGAKGPADMGKVMKTLLPKIQGRAPNDLVSRIVRQMLTL